MAVYAIGDIQGCYRPLRQLLDALHFDPARDELWLTGDLVNRGPDSVEVLRFLCSLGSAVHSVLGNHDLHLLAISEGYAQQRRSDTLSRVLEADDRDHLLHWLRHRPLIYSDNRIGWLLVHAGIYPFWTGDEALTYAKELESMLRGDHYRRFLEKMYGERPATWTPSLTSWERLRFITNALTRMRYLDHSGALCLTEKAAPGSQPNTLIPWYSFPNRKRVEEKIVFGHWASLGLQQLDRVMAIDRGCVWNGRLTAVQLDAPSPLLTAVDCLC